MKPIKQYIKTKKSEKLKKKFLRSIDALIKKQNNFSSIDVKSLGAKIGLIESTSLEYAKQWRRLHPKMTVINITHRVDLTSQAYFQYVQHTGRKKAYATHYSITVPTNIIPLIEKFASFRYDKNGEAYLWIDEREYFSKDSLRNAKNFFKVFRKWLDEQIDIHYKDIHTYTQKTDKILNKGIKPKKTGALQHIAKKSWKEINRMIKEAKLGIHPDFEQVSTNCTPYIYKQYTFTYTYNNNCYYNNILSSKKTQKITKNLNKQERKSRYFEKYNKKIYHIRMLANFRTLIDGLKYNCGVGDFTKSKLHREILQEKGGSRLYKKENEAFFVNMYLKFRYNEYRIDKKKPINLKEEIEIIREFKDGFKKYSV